MARILDIAKRVHDHTWKLDPIVRSLLDTDFYKLLMCQSVFRNRRDVHVTFSLINRSKAIRLADLVDEGELREQLDHFADRVKVLERIVTDKGLNVAAQIEALRDTRRVDELDAGMPLGLEKKERV